VKARPTVPKTVMSSPNTTSHRRKPGTPVDARVPVATDPGVGVPTDPTLGDTASDELGGMVVGAAVTGVLGASDGAVPEISKGVENAWGPEVKALLWSVPTQITQK